MPWSPATQRVARAVAHGWQPTGSAKGFSRGFASQVLRESEGKRKLRKHRGMTLGDLGRGNADSR